VLELRCEATGSDWRWTQAGGFGLGERTEVVRSVVAAEKALVRQRALRPRRRHGPRPWPIWACHPPCLGRIITEAPPPRDSRLPTPCSSGLARRCMHSCAGVAPARFRIKVRCRGWSDGHGRCIRISQLLYICILHTYDADSAVAWPTPQHTSAPHSPATHGVEAQACNAFRADAPILQDSAQRSMPSTMTLRFAWPAASIAVRSWENSHFPLGPKIGCRRGYPRRCLLGALRRLERFANGLRLVEWRGK
jgi:hypothetical protein